MLDFGLQDLDVLFTRRLERKLEEANFRFFTIINQYSLLSLDLEAKGR
jgi:hypothetical protein